MILKQGNLLNAYDLLFPSMIGVGPTMPLNLTVVDTQNINFCSRATSIKHCKTTLVCSSCSPYCHHSQTGEIGETSPIDQWNFPLTQRAAAGAFCMLFIPVLFGHVFFLSVFFVRCSGSHLNVMSPTAVNTSTWATHTHTNFQNPEIINQYQTCFGNYCLPFWDLFSGRFPSYFQHFGAGSCHGQLYLQHFGVGTFHFPVYLQNFGAQTFHLAWYFATRDS